MSATVALPPLLEIPRPNGALYRPRHISVESWEIDNGQAAEPEQGVVVFGTHDVEASAEVATHFCREWFGANHARWEETGWWTISYLYGELTLVRQFGNHVRSRAGIKFTAVWR